MALFGLIESEEERRNERMMKKFGNRADDYQSMVDSLLQQTGNRSDDAYQSAEQTARQRYGNAMQTTQDQLRQNNEAARTNLSRALMARGGGQQSVGQMGTTMNQQQQGTNEAVRRSLQDFYQMNQQAKARDLNRGDQLLSNQTSGAQNQFNTSQQLSERYASLERKRKQANNQMLMDLASTAASVATIA